MLRIAILMAGRGQRFIDAGFSVPKPLIDVYGKPMIQKVVENIMLPATFTFYVLAEHYKKYSLNYILPLICKNNPCKIILVDKVTQGAACTALLDESLKDSNDELLFVNSDQLVEWSQEHFINYMKLKNADGGIVTFSASHSKWSYVKVTDHTNIITELAEKKVISNQATAGIYFFKKASDFVFAAEQMISKNIKTNDEFYLAPCYNELIAAGKKILSYPVPEVYGLGTPEDLGIYLAEQAYNE